MFWFNESTNVITLQFAVLLPPLNIGCGRGVRPRFLNQDVREMKIRSENGLYRTEVTLQITIEKEISRSIWPPESRMFKMLLEMSVLGT